MASVHTEHLQRLRGARYTESVAHEQKTSLLTASTFPEEVMTIKLNDDRPVYTNLDVISGTVEYCPELEFNGRALLIELLGVAHIVRSTWVDNQYQDITTEWPFLRRTSQVDIDVAIQKSAFSIQIPSLLQPGQCPLGEAPHFALPPSIGCARARADGLDDLINAGTVCQITYLIRADLRCLDENTSRGHVSHRFQFIPKTNLLDTVIEDEIDESTVEIYEKPVLDIFKLSHGSVELSVNKNQKLFTTGTKIAMTSSLRISLRYKGSSPPLVNKVSLSLLSSTIRRSKHRHGETHPEHTSFTCRDLLSMAFDTKTTDWESSTTELHVWTLDVTLPVTLLDGQDTVCPPSFESCLIARRYKIRLNFGLSSTSGFLTLRGLQYTLPINIEADLRRHRYKNQSLHTESPSEVELVPTYSETLESVLNAAPVIAVPQYIDTIPDLERLRRPSWHCKAEEAPGSAYASDMPSPR